MNGESGGGAGRADRSTESPASRRACAARAQPPADSGMRVEGVHNHTLGLVQAFRPPALRPPLSRGRGKVTGKFGALEERAQRRRSSRGKSPLVVSRRSRPGESLRARSPCGLKERSHLRSAREVEGVG